VDGGGMQQLREAASRSIRALLATGLQEGDQPILEVLGGFLDKNNVRIQSGDLGELLYAAHLYEPNTGMHFIVINEKLLKIADGPTRKMATKRLFCHELSHMLLEHPAGFMPPEKMNPALQNAYTALMQFACDPNNNSRYENEAEVFSAAIGFWPLERFTRLFLNAKFDFRQIANDFKMPIDCAVKWALISFPLPMHYLKYNVPRQVVEDFYVPTDDYYSVFPWGFQSGAVFQEPDTTAYKCLHTIKNDHKDVTTTKQGGKEAAFFCRAFYLKSNETLLRLEDKVIVCGLPNALTGLFREAQ
jgi:hypothetical protein